MTGCGSSETTCYSEWENLDIEYAAAGDALRNEWTSENCSNYTAKLQAEIDYVVSNLKCLKQEQELPPDGSLDTWEEFATQIQEKGADCPCPDLSTFVGDPSNLISAYSNDPSTENCQALKSFIQGMVDKASELPNHCYTSDDEAELDELIVAMNDLDC